MLHTSVVLLKLQMVSTRSMFLYLQVEKNLSNIIELKNNQNQILNHLKKHFYLRLHFLFLLINNKNLMVKKQQGTVAEKIIQPIIQIKKSLCIFSNLPLSEYITKIKKQE